MMNINQYENHMFMVELSGILNDNHIDYYDSWYDDVDFSGPVD